MSELYQMQARQAKTLFEIPQATKTDVPTPPDHEFFVDFSSVRGNYQEGRIYRFLNVQNRPDGLSFDVDLAGGRKTLVFLGGMRGSGKSTELAKYVDRLNHPGCFFCVVCNLDQELDMNDLEYMDIVVFQLEKLAERMKEEGIQVGENAIRKLEEWFASRIVEINKNLKGEVKLEAGIKAEAGFWKILNIFGAFRAGVSGSAERKTTIRQNLKNNFIDFSDTFNTFIEECNRSIRAAGKGKEILFVVDGLEKTMTMEMRRKIVIDESNRLRSINAYTIFTLPIELMKNRQSLMVFAKVVTFPFVKLEEKNGTRIDAAYDKFKEFVYKRVDKALFETEDVVEKAVYHSGGSPRELLSILMETFSFNFDNDEVLTMASLDQALESLSHGLVNYMTKEEFEKLKEIYEGMILEAETDFDPVVEELTERIILMEYNDGSYKKPHPLVAMSKIYKERVLGE